MKPVWGAEPIVGTTEGDGRPQGRNAMFDKFDSGRV